MKKNRTLSFFLLYAFAGVQVDGGRGDGGLWKFMCREIVKRTTQKAEEYRACGMREVGCWGAQEIVQRESSVRVSMCFAGAEVTWRWQLKELDGYGNHREEGRLWKVWRSRNCVWRQRRELRWEGWKGFEEVLFLLQVWTRVWEGAMGKPTTAANEARNLREKSKGVRWGIKEDRRRWRGQLDNVEDFLQNVDEKPCPNNGYSLQQISKVNKFNNEENPRFSELAEQWTKPITPVAS